MTFSTDGKFLITACYDGHIYTWDVSALAKEAGLLYDIVDGPAPKMKGARRIPRGFFDPALREANLRIRLSQSHGPHYCPTPAPRQRTLSSFSSFWRHSKPHGTTEHDTQFQSRPLSWTRNLVFGILRRRDGSDIQLREVEVPCTWAKPVHFLHSHSSSPLTFFAQRNYHARKKPAASSSRPSNTRTTQQHSMATQSTLSSSQLPPPTVAGTAVTTSRPNIAIRDSGWRTRLMLWVCCVPIQSVDGHH
ncbi:hypothetical protein BDR03DRAFT_952907 [Suillus americanus]|nr:hypothetical protein BDR03DRAFT_952907 [Suillus americanus]